MASRWMSRPDTSIGRTWASSRAATTGRSNAPTSTAGIAGSSSPKAARSRQSSSRSIGRTANCTGATAKGCASCARTWTDRASRSSCRPATGTTIAAIRRGGASASPSTRRSGRFYWTQKGSDNAGVGRICCAGIEMPQGDTAATRRDITLLFDRLPEPIDLELDAEHRLLYWTDRGDAPDGNTVNRTPIDTTPKREIVMGHLGEGIGIALDVRHDRMFVTELAGTLYSARMDGSEVRVLAGGQGNLTGIAYTEGV